MKNNDKTKAPHWSTKTIDVSRDRKTPKPKGKGPFGGPRQHGRDLKHERLELQAGCDQDILGMLSNFSEFVSLNAVQSWYLFSWQASIDIYNFMEAFILFCYDSFRARSILDIIVACAHFVKHFTRVNLLSSEHLDNLRSILGCSELQLGEREYLESFRDLLRNWERCKTSPLMRKISKVLIYCSTAGFYSGGLGIDVNEKVENVQKHFEQYHFQFCTDFVYYVLELLHFVCDKTYGVVYEGLDAKSIFSSDIGYDKWLDAANEHLAKSKFLSNPEAYEIDIHTYLLTLRKLIDTGREIYKFSCEIDRRVKALVRKTTFELTNVEMEIISRESAQMMRPCPFAVVIEGESSVGKSKVAEAIHMYFGKLFDKPLTGKERFSKSATAEFWDGFCTYMWSVLIDDAGMWKSGLDMIDQSITDIVRIVNNMPYMPNMASLDDKGKTPLKCELVVVTTNVPDLKLNEYFEYPFAAARRLPWHIRVKPKEENIGERSNNFMLDPTRAKLSDGVIPDSWTFQIYEPIADKFGNPRFGVQMRCAKLVKYGEPLDMRGLLMFIKEKATIHRQHQDAVVGHSRTLQNIELCEDCALPDPYCQCRVPQFGTEYYITGIFERILFIILCNVFDLFVKFGICLIFTRWFQKRMHHQFCSELRQLRIKAEDRYCRARRKLVPSKQTIILSSIIVGILALYKLFKYTTTKQGASLSSWGTKYPEMDEQESYWKGDDYVVDTFDSTPQSLSLKTMDHDQILNKFRRNTAYLRVLFEGKWKYCRLINICGQKYITPNHCIPVGSSRCQIIKGQAKQNFSQSHYFVLSESSVQRFPDRDICVVTINSLPPGCDIREYFVKDVAANKGPAFYLSVNRDLTDLFYDVPFSELKYSSTLTGGNIYPHWRSFGVITQEGDCGSMLCRQDDMGFRILGMHQSYCSNVATGYACALSLTYEFIHSIDCSREVGVVTPQLGKCGEHVDLKKISRRSPIRDVEKGTAQLFGRVGGFCTSRSKVKQTILCDDLLDLGFPLNYAPPVMNKKATWSNNLRLQTEADCVVAPSVLNEIEDAMLDEWIELVPQCFKDEIRILDMKTSVNGQRGVKFIDKINRKTSAGYPWNKSKKNLIYSIPGFPGEDLIEFSEEVMERVEKRLCDYGNLQRTFPIYTASLKDEALPHRKIISMKTRIFMGAPVDFTIVVRSVLLSFVRVVQKNKLIFESAPGTEAQCIEWDVLYRYLTTYGENNMVFGDFSGFDVTMRADFMMAAFRLIERFHKHCGASQEHLNIIRALSYDVVFPLVNFDGDLIQFSGKNPSGQPLTVIINGLVNCMYMRYCYRQLNPLHELRTFRSNVKLLTYGDDNGMGITNDVAWFNHTSIALTMRELGVIYTMPDKVSVSQNYVHISEADFLKRKWRFEEAVDAFVCPLELDSIIKSLMIGVKKSANMTDQEHAASIMDSAHAEFFWHGKSVFHEWDIILRSLIESHNLVPYMPGEIPTWDDYCERFRKNSEKYLKATVEGERDLPRGEVKSSSSLN